MLIALIILVVLDLALTFVVFCGQRALWARLPEPSSSAHSFTVGDIASADAIRAAAAAYAQRPEPAQQ